MNSGEPVTNEINDFICLHCNSVFPVSGEPKCWRCKDSKVVPFDPETHWRLLIGSANAWAQIDRACTERWKDTPVYRSVWDYRASHGNYGYAANISMFVDRLLGQLNLQGTNEEEAFEEWFYQEYENINPESMTGFIREVAWKAWCAGRANVPAVK